jgi:hypothetical protein
MSILDEEYKKKVNQLSKKKSLNNFYLERSLEFKNALDDFKLISKIEDNFFIELYKKNFSDILEFEIINDFNYSTDDIYDMEEKLKDISIFNFVKYDKILDYMIIKSGDVSDYYGTTIKFILNLFNEIKNNFELVKKVKNIWKKEYISMYPKFSDFQKSKDFETVVLLISSERKFNHTSEILDFSDLKDMIEFLIFTSINSDFRIYELNDENIFYSLFNNNYDLFKKNGYNLLETIKNRIISYN